MPVIFPLARLEFESVPDLGFVPDQSTTAFLDDWSSLTFNLEAVIAFDFSPYSVELVPTNSMSLTDEDTGFVLVDEDNPGQSFIAEEAT